ncbi:MAG: hypothetical protein WA821_06995 [Anaerolineales bacterium]
MINRFSKFLDHASAYLAPRKGLLPLVGIGLILLNLLLVSILPPDWYLVRSNLLLHLGVIVALIGVLLSWAL